MEELRNTVVAVATGLILLLAIIGAAEVVRALTGK